MTDITDPTYWIKAFKAETTSKTGTEKKQESDCCDDTCKNCGERNDQIEYDGYVVCKLCGDTRSIVIFQGTDQRFYGAEDSKHKSDPTRLGAPIDPLLPNFSYRTYVQGGRGWLASRYHKFANAHGYQETRFMETFKMIDALMKFCGVQNTICNDAKIMFTVVYPHQLIRGINVDRQALYIFYLSCIKKNYLITAKEAVDTWNRFQEATGGDGSAGKKQRILNAKDLVKGSKLFLELYYALEPSSLIYVRPLTMEQYVEMFLTKIGLLDELYEGCCVVIRFVREYNLLRCGADKTAVAVIFYMIGFAGIEGQDKNKICTMCNDAHYTTIGKAYKIVYDNGDYYGEYARDRGVFKEYRARAERAAAALAAAEARAARLAAAAAAEKNGEKKKKKKSKPKKKPVVEPVAEEPAVVQVAEEPAAEEPAAVVEPVVAPPPAPVAKKTVTRKIKVKVKKAPQVEQN